MPETKKVFFSFFKFKDSFDLTLKYKFESIESGMAFLCESFPNGSFFKAYDSVYHDCIKLDFIPVNESLTVIMQKNGEFIFSEEFKVWFKEDRSRLMEVLGA